MITTSPKRVKAAGYWCDDADRQSEQLMQETGLTLDDEYPMDMILDRLGLGTALLSLGSPHPRYKHTSTQVLLNYCRLLFAAIRKSLEELTAVQTDLHLEEQVFDNPVRLSLRRDRVEYWTKEKFNTVDPALSLLYDALLILLSDQPLQIKAIHAGKNLLGSCVYSNPNSDMLDKMKASLKELIICES